MLGSDILALPGAITTMTNIADALPSMVAYWDDNLICRYANSAHFEWFDKEPSEIIGRTWANVLGEELVSINADNIKTVVLGETQSFERLLTNPKGNVDNILTEYIPDFDKCGNVNDFFVLSTDIRLGD